MPPNESNGDYECGRDSTCPDYHFLSLVKVAERGMRLSADRVWKVWEQPILDPRPACCKNVFRPVVCDQARNTAPNAIARTSDIFFMILFQPPRTESKEGAERLYWKKVKSPSQREVVKFNGVRSIFTKIMQTAQVVSRADTGERNKIADQMRLVEIALF